MLNIFETLFLFFSTLVTNDRPHILTLLPYSFRQIRWNKDVVIIPVVFYFKSKIFWQPMCPSIGLDARDILFLPTKLVMSAYLKIEAFFVIIWSPQLSFFHSFQNSSWQIKILCYISSNVKEPAGGYEPPAGQSVPNYRIAMKSKLLDQLFNESLAFQW